MKRDALDRALSRIKTKRPLFFWRQCREFSVEYKNRWPIGAVKMWKIRVTPSQSSYITGDYDVYACRGCYGDMGDVLKTYSSQIVHSQWVKRHKIDGPLELP